MKRKRHRDLYEIHTRTDPDTGREWKEAFYRGNYYRLSIPSKEKQRMGVKLSALILPAIFLYLLCGLLNLPSSRSFYILPFYLFAIFPLFYAALAVVRFFRLPQAFTEIQKAECVDSFLHSCMGLMGLSVLYAMGLIVFLILGGAEGRLMDELLGLICILGAGGLSALARREMDSAGKAALEGAAG